MKALELEAMVCGALLRDPRNVAEAVAAFLDDRHFQLPLHQHLFQVAVQAWDRGEELDLSTICRAVGYEHLDDVSRIRTNAPIHGFSRLLQELLDVTRQLDVMANLSDVTRALAGRKLTEPLEPILERLLEVAVASKGTGKGLRTSPLPNALDRSIGALEERVVVRREGQPPGIPTGFDVLDGVVYGWQPGFVYILGARTSIGKTTMAVNMALSAATAGHKTAFVTVEMSDSDVVDKMLSRVSRVDIGRMLSGSLSEADLDRIHFGTGKLKELPLLFTEVEKPSIDLLACEIMRLAKTQDVKFVIVDYLQLFDSGEETRYRNSREETKAVSIRLKSLAKTLKIPILVLSQLSRQAPEVGEPDLRDIAESDQIARDADVVLFLFKNEDDEYLMSVGKNRRGSKKAFRINAELQFNLFSQGREIG